MTRSKETSAVIYASANLPGIDAQLDRLRVYARERDLPVAREVIERCHGRRAGRPRLRVVRAGIAAGEVILAVAVAAVASSARALADLVTSLHERKGGLVLLEEGIDTTDSADGALALITSLAVLERSRAREHALEGQRRARDEGRQIGRARVLSPELAEQARALRAQGLSWRRVARELGVADRSLRRATAHAANEAGAA